MQTHSKIFKSVFFLTLLCLGLGACNKKQAPTPTPAVPPQTATELPAPAAPAQAPSAPTAAGYEGSWNGNSGEDLPVSFTVANNQLKDIYVSYRVKIGSCTAFASFSSDNTANIQGKSFTATGKKDQMNDHIEFTMNGTFTSDSEASGTLKWTGKSGLCGDIDTQANWTAKKGELPTEE